MKVEYYLDDRGENKYSEEKSVTDRNGNTTVYERDGNGNFGKLFLTTCFKHIMTN